MPNNPKDRTQKQMSGNDGPGGQRDYGATNGTTGGQKQAGGADHSGARTAGKQADKTEAEGRNPRPTR